VRSVQALQLRAGNALGNHLRHGGRRGLVTATGDHQRRAGDAGVAGIQIDLHHGSAGSGVGRERCSFQHLAQCSHASAAAVRIRTKLRREPALHGAFGNRRDTL
jgi:hypothetical protein